MKKSLTLPVLFLLFLAFPLLIIAKTSLTGAIVIGNAEVMKYRIDYSVNRDNTITGISIADQDGKEETRAVISGRYNPKTKELLFNETSIVSTSSQSPLNEFCLMKVTGKLESKGNRLVFTGTFSATAKSSEVICDSGSIMLMDDKTLTKLKDKSSKAITKAMADTAAKGNQPTDWKYTETDLGSGGTGYFKLSGDAVRIEVVDDRFQDGDRITLMMNSETLAKNLEITNAVTGWTQHLPADQREITFRLISESEGTVALTTVKVALRHGNSLDMVNVALNKGESVTIVLKK